MAELWNGSLRVESSLGSGTQVTIEIPAAPPPEWLAREIRISAASQIAILDDDPKIALLWRNRIARAGIACGGVVEFTQAADFKEWARQHADRAILYLVDYELTGQTQNGLSVIEELGISDRAILVTGRYDDPSLQKNVRWIGARMSPRASGASAGIRIRRRLGKSLTAFGGLALSACPRRGGGPRRCSCHGVKRSRRIKQK